MVTQSAQSLAPTIARSPAWAAPAPAVTPSWQTAPAPAEQTIARMPYVPAETGKTYETVVDELRLDLLRQRERMGDLLGDLPWA